MWAMVASRISVALGGRYAGRVDNRCPHRGMALSAVRENLACLYHGWHFGCEGGAAV